jgi:hypothetical protein
VARSSDYDRNLLLKAQAPHPLRLGHIQKAPRVADGCTGTGVATRVLLLSRTLSCAVVPARHASLFPLQNVSDDMVRLLGPFAPREMLELIRQEMTIALSLLMIVAFTLIVVVDRIASISVLRRQL